MRIVDNELHPAKTLRLVPAREYFDNRISAPSSTAYLMRMTKVINNRTWRKMLCFTTFLLYYVSFTNNGDVYFDFLLTRNICRVCRVMQPRQTRCLLTLLQRNSWTKHPWKSENVVWLVSGQRLRVTSFLLMSRWRS